ncbi:MAG: GMC family oxidoreductase N-terminal domain-containing protein, partial [Chloroflexi bacterium]|nr:GMC family oxidoreductase N-terminal domain-containing protein [Chloroflexota bacterium]
QNDLHGAGGPITIHRPDDLVPFQQAFLDACETMNYPECADHNDPSTTGYGPHPMNKRGRLRISTALAYLMPVRKRPNLVIRPDTHVVRVVVAGGKATGLEVETDGVRETIDASRIVLSAGSIQTPPILIRSGIGPCDVLERLSISIVREAPVGARLCDHPATLIGLVPKPGIADRDQPLIQTTLRYTAKGSSDENDMQLEPISFVQRGQPDDLLVGLAPVVEKTRGHGRLIFESADPYAQPAIQSDFLNDPWDEERMMEGIDIALMMCETPEIKAVTENIVWPREEVIEDREKLRSWARRASASGYHPCGTAPMGAGDDEGAVVDQYGRVYGVDGLFVADASIMPAIPRANINIPTIMIGERFGEWFRERLI